MRTIATLWTKHLDTKEKQEQFEKLLRNSGISLGRLRDIVQEMSDALERSEVKSDTFDNPNWAYKQAYSNGLRAAYGNILQLLKFLDQ